MTLMQFVILADTVAIPALALAAWKGAGYVAKKTVDQHFMAATESLKHEHDKAVEGIRHEHTRAIEALRGDQSRGLEHLKGEVSASLNRITKLHQYEFDVLPEAWRLLHVAVGELQAAAGTGIINIVDVAAMNSQQLEGFLAELTWPDAAKDEIRRSSDKQKV